MIYTDSRKYGYETPFFRLVMAVDYFNAAIERSKIFFEDVDLNSGKILMPSISFPGTCLSFSIELSLKALLYFKFDVIDRNQHRILVLFDKLPNDKRMAIYKQWKFLNFRFRKVVDIMTTAMPTGTVNETLTFKNEKTSGYKGFRKHLEQIDNLFISSRYLYESIPEEGIENGIRFPLNFSARLGYVLVCELAKSCDKTYIGLRENDTLFISEK